jgi:hypothetical protein
VGDLNVPKPLAPSFSTYRVDLHVRPDVVCDTDEEIETMSERIEDADIETVVRTAVNAALEKAGLDGELTVTVRT